MTTIPLPKSLGTDAADGLKSLLEKHAGQHVTLSGGEVGFIGGLCFQVLVSARAKWAATGHRLTIDPASPALESGLQRLGMPLDTFGEETVT